MNYLLFAQAALRSTPPPPRQETLLHLVSESGMLGYLSIFLFLALLVCFICIFAFRLRYRYRIAILPLIFVPFFLGLWKLVLEILRYVASRDTAGIGDPTYFQMEGGLVFIFACIFTCILLPLASLLFLYRLPMAAKKEDASSKFDPGK
jgi:hypothetical protein